MVVYGLYLKYGDDLRVIHGGAPGLDNMAGEVATEILGVSKVEVFPADWTRLGNAAGPVRNRQMLEESPDLVVAFHNDLWGKSKGTKDMVLISREAKIPVYLISEVI
jgi:hypothetical protein